MTRGLIALCIVLTVQVISAYEVAVPVFRQPHGVKDNIRIVNGQTAAKGQFPYQAAVTLDYYAFCGGSLISKNYVMVAGHCISGFVEWVVDLGAHDLREDIEPGRVTLTSEKGIKHENYDPNTLANDIGLIALPEEVKLTDTVNILALPPRSYQHENFVGHTVRVSGWGRTSDRSEDMSPTLQFVDLYLISQDECRKAYGNFITKERYCCKGVDFKSTCGGDSGGPLTIGSGKNLTSIGIVSFGAVSGCEMGHPVGFTATPFFIDWISNKTGIAIKDF